MVETEDTAVSGAVHATHHVGSRRYNILTLPCPVQYCNDFAVHVLLASDNEWVCKNGHSGYLTWATEADLDMVLATRAASAR